MKIVIIGGGAMGSIYAGHLSTNNEVYMVDINQDVVDKVNKDGLVVLEDGKENIYKPKAVTDSKGIGTADLIIVFVKSIFSESALRENMHLIGNNTALMTLQNGAGHEKILSKFVPLDRVIIGTTEDNGAVVGLGKVRRGGDGKTNIGSIAKNPKVSLEKIKESFDKSGFKVEIHDNIQQLIWNKIITNASLSSVTAILQCSMGYIARDEYAWKMTQSLFNEVINTGEALGLKFDREKELEKVRMTSMNNPEGYTSIYADIKNGRKTEVDTISGAVVQTAKEVGVEVPVSEFVVNMIHALENSKRDL
ncbi:MAG: 2-dehydropantoate 2-reductase [Peptoniphilaceae bacterium]|nr:2-dehydropantoate 2-reductase [Peptoniphilaceae bacterium]MDY6019276.1 2-dehydropantoate 2-reductase [Anaerococcus sp.]